MDKILSSVQVTNIEDNIISIGSFNFPANTKVSEAPDTEGIVCILEESGGNLFLSFGVEEGDNVTVTFEDDQQQEYWETSKNHIFPILENSYGILFGGHPKPRPPKVVE